MGTNYYLRKKPCPTCNHPEKELHIGKSSGGWCFALHVIPEENINSLLDWKKLFENPENKIYNEEDDIVSPDEMIKIITKRSFTNNTSPREDFYKKHRLERGPNGLVRHEIGRFCIGHGEGTYDLVIGEFS